MAIRLKAFLLLFLILLIPLLSSGMVEDLKDDMHPKYSLYNKFGARMNSRKLLDVNVVLDYDYAGANPKHDPRKKPGIGGGKP